MIQGNNGKNGVDGIKGDKGDKGQQGLRGNQVEVNIIKFLHLEVCFLSFVLCLLFFYRVTKDSLVCQETKGGRAKRCSGLFLSVN